MYFLAFGANFISSWIRIRIPNADPDSGDKSNADPDPKHCMDLQSICPPALECGFGSGYIKICA